MHTHTYKYISSVVDTPTASLLRGKIPQWVSWYGTKQSDGEVPVMQELWGMRSTPLLPLLSDPFWPR